MLKLADNLYLPLEAATRRLAILAMSGAGKSNTAVVLAEQMFDVGIPWVAIDPKGDWWGVRSSHSGKGPGLPIPIFGGLHGDIPLAPTAGNVIGDLIVDQRLTCVLDISEFPDRQQLWGFLIDLGETLLRRNRQALHLFLEEADEYLPQRTSEKGNLPKCLGVWQRVIKRGRFRGIGSTQITQRNASLNKDTLYQAEALIAMRVTGKADRDAVAGWVEYHNAARDIVASLPTLEDGEAWVSSPAWLRQTTRVRMNRRRTFDSGATPVMLKGTAPAATLADVDLAKLQERMAATIEKAKADDPAELRKQIADLKRQLASQKPAEPQRVEVPVPLLSDDDRKLLHRINDLVGGELANLASMRDSINQLIQRVTETQKAAPPRAPLLARTAEKSGHKMTEKISAIQMGRGRPISTPIGKTPGNYSESMTRPRSFASPQSGDLPQGELKILTACGQYPDGASREQLTILSGYKRSSRDTYIQRLSQRGLVEARGDQIVISQVGLDALGPNFEPLPVGSALQDFWRQRLPSGERVILDVLLEAGGRPVDRELLTERTGYQRSSRDTYLQRLGARKLAINVGRGMVQAAELLFD